jgi:eukaryotic-like serine/threonine-protein kinase
MLTGRLAFPAETISDTIARILEHEPDWSALPAETPVTIRRLLLRCLAKNPKRRLRDIGDARIELDAIAEEPTGGASEPGESRLPSKARTARLPWVVVGVLTSGFLLVFMLWAPWRIVAPREPLRLRADLGADGSLANSIANQYGEATVLSPDGTVVAFVAQKGETGRKQLYVRHLNQLRATPLSGTEDALSPFFSPDGRWIGFSADQKLKKIAVTGGASATLCDVPELRGGSWSEDGTIVFSHSDQGSTHLLRVSSEGGEPAPLTASVDGEVAQLCQAACRSYRWCGPPTCGIATT